MADWAPSCWSDPDVKTIHTIYAGRSWRDGALRLALLAALWWGLAGEDARSWLVGVPMVLAATFVSGVLTPAVAWRWSWIGTVRFAGFFLRHSLIGGVDVAWRALHPRLPIQPGFVTIRLRLATAAARVCLANVISLLPGTLAANLAGEILVVHTVDARAPVTRNIQEVEVLIAAMFCQKLAPENEGQP
jgi:multicomponent Na+:H+ antiporter subunit E